MRDIALDIALRCHRARLARGTNAGVRANDNPSAFWPRFACCTRRERLGAMSPLSLGFFSTDLDAFGLQEFAEALAVGVVCDNLAGSPRKATLSDARRGKKGGENRLCT